VFVPGFRLGPKNWPKINTLAHFAGTQVMNNKGFTTLTPAPADLLGQGWPEPH
jgi:hypothetical protein